MIDTAKVIDLVDAIRFSRTERNSVKIATEWLTQNLSHACWIDREYVADLKESYFKLKNESQHMCDKLDQANREITDLVHIISEMRDEIHELKNIQIVIDWDNAPKGTPYTVEEFKKLFTFIRNGSGKTQTRI